jgi:hypothetical protein
VPFLATELPAETERTVRSAHRVDLRTVRVGSGWQDAGKPTTAADSGGGAHPPPAIGGALQ